MKTILLEIPSFGQQVILSPVDSVVETYRALLPEGTLMEFQRILALKADQQSIIDDFNKCGSGIAQPSIPPPAVPSAPTIPSPTPAAPSAIPNPTTVGFSASREDVLTRAAALGRGAATTGFKRFLALTEAAKDRKDGTFKKLFNA